MDSEFEQSGIRARRWLRVLLVAAIPVLAGAGVIYFLVTQ